MDLNLEYDSALKRFLVVQGTVMFGEQEMHSGTLDTRILVSALVMTSHVISNYYPFLSSLLSICKKK